MSKNRKPLRVWGLTGGIATGKSLVAATFEELGIPVVDADEIARESRQAGGPAHAAILARFGTEDPAKLRELLFGSGADPAARKDLEAILHPLIIRKSTESLEHLARLRPDAPFLLYEAALLVETGRYRDFEGLIVVTAPLEDRIHRLMVRDGATEGEARRIISAQASDEQRKIAATHIIENTGSIGELKLKVAKLLLELS